MELKISLVHCTSKINLQKLVISRCHDQNDCAWEIRSKFFNTKQHWIDLKKKIKLILQSSRLFEFLTFPLWIFFYCFIACENEEREEKKRENENFFTTNKRESETRSWLGCCIISQHRRYEENTVETRKKAKLCFSFVYGLENNETVESPRSELIRSSFDLFFFLASSDFSLLSFFAMPTNEPKDLESWDLSEP